MLQNLDGRETKSFKCPMLIMHLNKKEFTYSGIAPWLNVHFRLKNFLKIPHKFVAAS